MELPKLAINEDVSARGARRAVPVLALSFSFPRIVRIYRIRNVIGSCVAWPDNTATSVRVPSTARRQTGLSLRASVLFTFFLLLFRGDRLPSAKPVRSFRRRPPAARRKSFVRSVCQSRDKQERFANVSSRYVFIDASYSENLNEERDRQTDYLSYRRGVTNNSAFMCLCIETS